MDMGPTQLTQEELTLQTQTQTQTQKVTQFSKRTRECALRGRLLCPLEHSAVALTHEHILFT